MSHNSSHQDSSHQDSSHQDPPPQDHLRCNILTAFPEAVRPYFESGITGRAIERGLMSVDCVNFRDYAEGRYKAIDDVPFGGGPGVVLKPEPIARALDALAERGELGRVILTAPNGKVFTQRDAERLSAEPTLTFLCGRYEGIDARINIEYVNEVLSIGDYVLSGGELASMVIIDALARLRPGALNNADSAVYESHSLTGQTLLEHQHYTRPATWRGHEVPPVLLSGHHQRIQAWRRRESIKQTARVRPELLDNIELTLDEQALISELLHPEEREP